VVTLVATSTTCPRLRQATALLVAGLVLASVAPAAAERCQGQASPSSSKRGWVCPVGMRFSAEAGVCLYDGPQVERTSTTDPKTGVVRPVVTARYTCRNQLIEGALQVFHDNGKPALTASFKAGVEVGASTTWFENGRLERRGAYVDGMPLASGKRGTTAARSRAAAR